MRKNTFLKGAISGIRYQAIINIHIIHITIPLIHVDEKRMDLTQTNQSWLDVGIYRLADIFLVQCVGVDSKWMKTKQTTSAFSMSRFSCIQHRAIVSAPPAARAFAMAFPIPAMIKVLCTFEYSAVSSLVSHSPYVRLVYSNVF